jgi:hypothetical protein
VRRGIITGNHKTQLTFLVIFFVVIGYIVAIRYKRYKIRKVLNELLSTVRFANENYRLTNSIEQRLIGEYNGHKVAVGIKSLKEQEVLILEVLFPLPINIQIKGEADIIRTDKATNSLCLGKYAELNGRKWTEVFDELIVVGTKT